MTHTRTTILARLALALTALSMPAAALAYLDPYDVLFPNELSLPASGRDAQARIERQQRESAARRDREQANLFAEQYPPVEDTEEFVEADTTHASAPEVVADVPLDRNTLSLIRALERVQEQQARAQVQQQVVSLLQQHGLHSGAPLLELPGGKGLPTGSKGPLYPTGMGSVIATLVLCGAVIWTLWRARRSERLTRA